MTAPSEPRRRSTLTGWLVGALMVGSGLFCIGASLADWQLFFEDRRARPVVEVLGRSGARGFYVLFGLGAVVLGVWLARSLREERR